MCAAAASGGGGSSPLTRGKPLLSLAWCEIERLIPAHAGKTSYSSAAPTGQRAHPRSRGENPVKPWCPSHSPGSSPLTRGKLGEEAVLRAGGGLIPAHAGKTSTPSLAATRTRAHPRSRGENREGSIVWPPPPAHPRSRGENHEPRRLRPLMPGSSPLTRGKRHDGHQGVRRSGLIPAHAGKTHGRRLQRQEREAHPRSRGENTRARRTRPTGAGSSPLTRGKLTRRASRTGHDRLIPAHAGKTRGGC